MKNSITYVAMDTHKKQHTLAIYFPGQHRVVQMTIANTNGKIRQMVKKLKKSTDGPIHFCYEAGICGFSLQRQIEALGCCCMVIAPSLIPRKPGERIKTDRRWERGANENTNGLIRQYFPKKMSFVKITAEQITFVQNSLNTRPRKCIDFKPPDMVYFNYVA